jgi:hypothetical protein
VRVQVCVTLGRRVIDLEGDVPDEVEHEIRAGVKARLGIVTDKVVLTTPRDFELTPIAGGV